MKRLLAALAALVVYVLVSASAGNAAAGDVEVLVADDEHLTRSGLCMILRSESGIRVVGEVADGLEAVAEAERLQPDVVLIDVRIPDGVEAIRRLGGLSSKTPRVLVLTALTDDGCIYDCLRAGVTGFLQRDSTTKEVGEGIRAVASGAIVLSPPVTRRLIDRFTPRPLAPELTSRVEALSPRELEVLRLVARGLSNQEIAEAMTLSLNTVKTHVAHLLAKLELRDRSQAVVFAYEAGVVEREQR